MCSSLSWSGETSLMVGVIGSRKQVTLGEKVILKSDVKG